MMAAVCTILLADLVMSLDNVIAVAAAAQGSMVLLVLGLAISIPLVIFGSTLMIKLMERFPIIIMLGAALIGWVGGETIVSDVALRDVLVANPWLHYAAAAAGALFVVAAGRLLQRRAHAAAHCSVRSADACRPWRVSAVSLFSTRPALSWEFAALTDVGRVRAHNEDAVHVDPVLGLALLADGMGGYKGGEVASAMAISLMHASFDRWFAQAELQAPARVVRRALQAATDEANTSSSTPARPTWSCRAWGRRWCWPRSARSAWWSGTSAIRAAIGCATTSWNCSRATIRCASNNSTPAPLPPKKP